MSQVKIKKRLGPFVYRLTVENSDVEVSRLLFSEVETDRDLRKAEGLPDPVDEIAFVGKVDGRRIPDEQGEGWRFDGNLRDVVEKVRPAPAARARMK